MTRHENRILFFYEDERETNIKDRVLSNFYASLITIEVPSELDINGERAEGSFSLGTFEVATAEHLFQALKLSRAETKARMEAIFNAETAGKAKEMAQGLIMKAYVRPD
jgi:predicted NAD-dependent protein-ADP-ribosyltransferase YbiA (DUF1768 family)